jgi:DNA-binding transcriptional ArsR family regulator
MSGSEVKLVGWLRAAGEPTRLRLLALCAERDLSVSDLAMALRQSEPRVSRHLKILSEAGLIARLRQGQWVHYQVAREGTAAAFIQGLLAQLDRNDPLFVRDRESLRVKGGDVPHAANTSSRLGRALTSFMDKDGTVAPSSVLLLGIEHPELLSVFASGAKRSIALAHSRRAAQAMRALVERERLNCRVLIATSEPIGSRDIERAGPPFAAILLDRLAAPARNLSHDLSLAGKALEAGGRLWLFERYESLETQRGRVVEHPIAQIRRVLSEAGFVCERLSPIEADGEHVLAASAVLAQESNARVA